MARLWTFAAGLNSLTVGHEFTSGNGSGALSISAFPSDAGRVAVRVNPSAASAWFGQIFKASASNTQAWIRTVIEVGTLPSSATEFVGLWNSGAGTRQAYCSIDSSGVVALRDSTGTAKVSSSALSAGIHVIEFTTTVNAGAASMELVIDGTSIGTSATGNTGNFDACYWGTPSGAGTYDIYLSEFAINDSSGSAQTAFPSTKNATTAAKTRIAYIRPSAQGDNNAWLKQGGGAGSSTNYQDVDEVTPDDATTYLKRTSTGAKVDDYNLPTAASVGIGASDTITLIQVGARVGSTSTTATGRNYAARIKSQASGTVQAGSTATCNVNGWVTHSQALPRNYQLTSYVDPQAGGAWTPSLIDSAQIGFTTVTSSANEIRVSTLWALIEYVVGGYSVSLTGAVTPTGAIIEQVNALKTGSITPSGAITEKIVPSAIAGSLAPSGAVTVSIVRPVSVTGSVSASGEAAGQVNKPLSGSLAPSGAILEALSVLQSGSLTPTGALSGQVNITGQFHWDIGDFESTVSPWVGMNGTTVTQVTTEHHSGSGAMEVTPPGVGFPEGPLYAAQPAAPEQQFRVSAWVKAPAGSNYGLQWDENDSTGSYLRTKVGATVTATGDWMEIVLDDITGADTRTFNIYIVTVSVIPDVYYVDDVTVDNYRLGGRVSPSGSTTEVPSTEAAGSLSPSGALVSVPQELVSGTLPSSGATAEQIAAATSGSIEPEGEAVGQINTSLSGGMAPTGEVALSSVIVFTVSGSLEPAGEIVEQVNVPLEGSATPTGAEAEAIVTLVSAAITPEGEVAVGPSVTVSASLTPSGATIEQISAPIAGSLTPSGLTAEQINHLLSGDVAPTGDVEAEAVVGVTVYEVEVTGALTPTGAISETVNRVLSGVATISGETLEQLAARVTGTVPSVGAPAEVINRQVSGSLAPSGTISAAFAVFPSGALTPTGSVTVPSLSARVSGALTPTGNVFERIAVQLSGILASPTGDVVIGFLGVPGSAESVIVVVGDAETVIELLGSLEVVSELGSIEGDSGPAGSADVSIEALGSITHG